MLGELGEIFPFCECKFYVMFILCVLLVDVLDVFGDSWVFCFQDLDDTVLELVGIFLDVLLRVCSQLSKSFLMVA